MNLTCSYFSKIFIFRPWMIYMPKIYTNPIPHIRSTKLKVKNNFLNEHKLNHNEDDYNNIIIETNEEDNNEQDKSFSHHD